MAQVRSINPSPAGDPQVAALKLPPHSIEAEQSLGTASPTSSPRATFIVTITGAFSPTSASWWKWPSRPTW